MTENIKKLTFSTKNIFIKKLTLLDFAGDQCIPFTLFSTHSPAANEQGLFSQYNNQKQENIINREKNIENIKKVLSTGITRSDISIEDILKNEQLTTFVYGSIILLACENVMHPIVINNNFATYLDAIAKRYGQRPSAFSGADMNDIEKYMFDLCIFNAGVSLEVEQNKKAMAKIKIRKR